MTARYQFFPRPFPWAHVALAAIALALVLELGRWILPPLFGVAHHVTVRSSAGNVLALLPATIVTAVVAVSLDPERRRRPWVVSLRLGLITAAALVPPLVTDASRREPLAVTRIAFQIVVSAAAAWCIARFRSA